MADQCGPWNLDQLDAFGSLDSLAFSLDDAIWTSADTCILDGAGSVTGFGNVTATVSLEIQREIEFLGTGSLSAIVIRELMAAAQITGTANLTASTDKIRTEDAAITGVGSLTALAGVEFSTEVRITGVGTLVAGVSYTVLSQAAINGSAALTADGYIYGQEWTQVPYETNTWTEI